MHEIGKDAVKQNPIKLVQCASGRKLGPYRALVQKLDEVPSSEAWKIPDELSESESGSESENSDSESDSDDSKENESMQE